MRAYRDSTRAKPVQPLGTHHVRLMIDDSALASYDRQAARKFAGEVTRRGTWLDPTLAVLRVAARMHEDSIARPTALRYVAPAVQRALPHEPLDAEASAAAVAAGRTRLRRWLDAFGELHRAGARFTTGTDVGFNGVVPGFSIHDELELLTQVGLSPAEALLAATRNAAEATGRLDRLGTVEPGKAADLIILNANPLLDIRNSRRIGAVIARGRVYDRGALDALLQAAETAARRRP